MSLKLALLLFALALTNLITAAEITSRLQVDGDGDGDGGNDSVMDSGRNTEETTDDEEEEKQKTKEEEEEEDCTGPTGDIVAATEESIVNAENQQQQQSNRDENDDTNDHMPMSKEEPKEEPKEEEEDEEEDTRENSEPPAGNFVRVEATASSVGGSSVGAGLMAKLRSQAESHDDVSSGFHVIEPRASPQMQLVDNTLRFMAIKSSVDDLAMRIFPNLRTMRHTASDDHM